MIERPQPKSGPGFSHTLADHVMSREIQCGDVDTVLSPFSITCPILILHLPSLLLLYNFLGHLSKKKKVKLETSAVQTD